ncbi:uncharacterized protein LOC120924781 [Rana temporaria]|uniref:uncharacterized protein LOC120924781 n=1 Tax=Rana temporaria TaxID=8407 RepID=UPI001AAD99F4|nr:uncharacterized protein LOC120924781 [Rana temporaria]
MHLEEIVYLSLLATDDRDFCYQELSEYTSEQLLECIRMAHVFIDHGSVLFDDVQPLIRICTELAQSDAATGRDDYTPPFSAAQVESLVWLLEDDSAFFYEQYSACPQQVLAACINSVQSLVRQARVRGASSLYRPCDTHAAEFGVTRRPKKNPVSRVMVILYIYIFQFCLMPQCVTLWRSGMESPACSLKLPDVIDEFEYFQDGDLIIGGVLTLRSKIEYLALPEEKTYSSSIRYYVNLLAFLYAIDNINQDPDILPNITLGFHLYDSWLEPKKGVQSVLQILSGPNGTVPNYSCKGHGKLAGVIGDQYSSTTIPIAEILGLYRYTQIFQGLVMGQVFWEVHRQHRLEH